MAGGSEFVESNLEVLVPHELGARFRFYDPESVEPIKKNGEDSRHTRTHPASHPSSPAIVNFLIYGVRLWSVEPFLVELRSKFKFGSEGPEHPQRTSWNSEHNNKEESP